MKPKSSITVKLKKGAPTPKLLEIDSLSLKIILLMPPIADKSIALKIKYGGESTSPGFMLSGRLVDSVSKLLFVSKISDTTFSLSASIVLDVK